MTSPADDLRALLARSMDMTDHNWGEDAADWMDDNAAHMLALLDAAQEYCNPGDGWKATEAFAALAAAVAALTEPRP